MKAFTTWWSRHLPKMTLLVLLATLVGMVYVYVTTTANGRQVRAQSVEQTAILGELRDIVRLGVDAETGSRGYILTEDISFLDPYKRAYRVWLTDIDRLEARFEKSGEAEDALAVGRIRALAIKKLEFINQVVTMTAQGRREQAIAEVKTSYGKELLDNIRDIVGQLEAKHQRKLTQTVAQADDIQFGVTAILVTCLLLVMALAYFSFSQERRASTVALLDQEAMLLRQGKEQADLIAQELNHRVKNLFAVILSLVTLSARGSKDVPETVEKIRNRIHALSLAHSVSQGSAGITSVSLRDLLMATLAPYHSAGNVVLREGPHIDLPTGTMTPLGLIVHELATNALKYGALSQADGCVTIYWEKAGNDELPEILILWRESGVTAVKPKPGKGFGSTMIAASTQQLKGQMEQNWSESGLEVRLQFPLN